MLRTRPSQSSRRWRRERQVWVEADILRFRGYVGTADFSVVRRVSWNNRNLHWAVTRIVQTLSKNGITIGTDSRRLRPKPRQALREAEGADPKGSRPHVRRPLELSRPRLRSLLRRIMLQRLQSCRLWNRLYARRSNGDFFAGITNSHLQQCFRISLAWPKPVKWDIVGP